MDSCLLCLESSKSFEDGIQVDSDKWKQQNLQMLIDKHLWPMQQTKPSSWVCKECGEELNDFHNFYVRIEIAQQRNDTVLKSENEILSVDQNNSIDSDSSREDCKDYLFDMKDGYMEPQIIMEQPLPTEFVIDGPFIKSEKEDSSDSDDKPLKQRRKRGRAAKEKSTENLDSNEDPLKKPKKSKTKINKTRKVKKSEDKQNDTQMPTNKSKEVTSPKMESTSLTEANDNNDSDTDQEPDLENPDGEQKEPLKKKNHRNLDEETTREYDRIIAENFKIFCNICQASVDNFIALRKHFKVEHKQRGYARCCKRNFFTRSLLVDHIHVHQNPDHFKCHECGKVFSDRSRLLYHKKLHEDNSKLEKCEICGKLFADKGSLKKHVLTHSNQKMFPCHICGKYFTNSFILNHHIEAVHQNKFVQICDICGKSIRCPTAFASHMEKHEIKTTPISCDVCGLLLSGKEGLKRHKNSQHPEGGKKEHSCHICSKVSPTLRALKAHIHSVHEQGFDFKCSLCDKSFKRAAVLREHMATHTGTALYACPWCPRTFISNGNMYNHRKNAHPKEWEELKRQKYATNVL